MSGPKEYCDLVMKGGLTSGLVYPTAVIALSKRYRFKSIGGTSAGAIAAAACAAAALGERRKELGPAAIVGDPDQAGMAGLGVVAARLRTKGFIYSLFQPVRGARIAYWLVVRLAAGPGLAMKSLLGAIAVIGAAGIEFVLALALLLALACWIGGPAGMWSALLPSGICAFALASVFAVLRLARSIRRNRLGICTGLSQKRPFRAGAPALTDWLHAVIQSLAGQPDGDPVSFDDLWSVPPYPGEPVTKRTLSLQMITTGVSHNEPRSLPFTGGKFWFLRADFDALFPKTVVDWMVAQDDAPITIEGKTYHPLPSGGALPIVVAARMSLSFPILISAVPLYEPDFGAGRNSMARTDDSSGQGPLDDADALTTGGATATPAADDRARYPFRICWFSDGGISSNFPIHLFDAPLPRWPTFAINLVYPDTDDAKQAGIFLPSENNQGWQRRYTSIARPSAIGEVGGFLFAIIGTMQNWRDLLLSRAAGQRDRIVHVPLDKTEGGMNLNMSQPVLESISRKGETAGQKLLTDFDFDNHYWLRWRNVAAAMERFTIDFAVGAGPPVSQSYAAAHESASTGEPLRPSYPIKTRAGRAEAAARFARMSADGTSWSATLPSLVPNAPKPIAHIQITPIY